MEINIFTHYFECSSCFIQWEEKKEEKQEESITTKKCSFCEKKEFNLGELIERQLDVIHLTSVNKFPTVVKNIWEYVKKEKNNECK